MAAILNFMLLVNGLRPRLKGFEGRKLGAALLRIAAGCAVLAAVAFGAWRVVAGSGPVALDLRHYAALALAIGLAAAAYLGVELALRSEEAGIVLDIARRRSPAL